MNLSITKRQRKNMTKVAKRLEGRKRKPYGRDYKTKKVSNEKD